MIRRFKCVFCNKRANKIFNGYSVCEKCAMFIAMSRKPLNTGDWFIEMCRFISNKH
jgi:hypothetical protein